MAAKEGVVNITGSVVNIAGFYTKHVFTECSPGNRFGREVKFIDDSTQINQVNYSNILVEYFNETNKAFVLRLFYPVRNAIVVIEAKRKNNKVKIKKCTTGYY